MNGRKLTITIIVYYFLYNLFARNFGLPEYFSYGIDILCISLYFCGIFNEKLLGKLEIKPLRNIFVALIVVTIISAISNFSNPLNYINGFRTQFATMSVFGGFLTYLKMDDFDKMIAWFYRWQWINLFCAFYQYFILGLSSDNNNGAFLNGNAQNVFCAVLCTFYYYKYLNREIPIIKFLFVLFSCLIIAALEEEKFIFIELVLILGYQMLTTRFSLKKITSIFLVFIAFYVGLYYLAYVNGESSMEVLVSQDRMIEYSQATYEGESYGLPRFGSSIVIKKMFFTDVSHFFWGLGLGLGDVTSIPFVDNFFADKYGYLMYSNFTFQYVFLHLGIVGTIIYLSFFFFLFFYNLKMRKRIRNTQKYIYDISNVIVLISFATIWYNGSLRWYFGVFLFGMLAYGVVATKYFKQNGMIFK